MLVERWNLARCCSGCGSEWRGTFAHRSLISLSSNCVWVRMLLRMLSACAPCIGFWINPTACSGQDQDPSDETIAEAPRIWFHHLRDNLLQVGFEQMIDVDPCLFISAKVICVTWCWRIRQNRYQGLHQGIGLVILDRQNHWSNLREPRSRVCVECTVGMLVGMKPSFWSKRIAVCCSGYGN